VFQLASAESGCIRHGISRSAHRQKKRNAGKYPISWRLKETAPQEVIWCGVYFTLPDKVKGLCLKTRYMQKASGLRKLSFLFW